MTTLVNAIESIFSILKDGNDNVYSEYEKIPIAKHEEIYATSGISKIKLENGFYGEIGKYYCEKYMIHVRILGSPNTPPFKLYNMIDLQILNKLTLGGYSINYAEILEPVQDSKLRRLVLECNIEITGRAEVFNEPQA